MALTTSRSKTRRPQPFGTFQGMQPIVSNLVNPRPIGKSPDGVNTMFSNGMQTQMAVTPNRKLMRGKAGGFDDNLLNEGFDWDPATQSYVSNGKQPSNPDSGMGEDTSGNFDDGSGDVGGEQSGGSGTIADDFGGGGAVGGTALPFDVSPFAPIVEPISWNGTSFSPIDSEQAKFIDPQEYAKKFGAFNREQFRTNFNEGMTYGLESLRNELKGLKDFAPEAANLSREQTGKDNVFNQSTRTAQVDATLPDARGTFSSLRGSLRDQADRAGVYAEGRLLDDNQDRARELGVRSEAADQAGFSGIGPRSGASRKISDLMSARERFQISQYGENLIGANAAGQQNLIANEANLMLAPTSYSQTGQQIRPTPEIGAGRAGLQTAGMINESTMLSPAQALTSVIGQEQYNTNLRQRTNEYNSTATLQNDQFNAQGQFNADQFNANMSYNTQALMFGYAATYAGQVQGANQGVLDSVLGAQTAGMGVGMGQAGLANAQNSQTIAAATQGSGIIASSLSGLGSIFSGGGDTNASVGGSGGSVGGTQVDTSPANSSSSGNSSSTAPTQVATTPTTTSAPAPITASGTDLSAAGAYKFAPGAAVPSGYEAISRNPDGSTTAINPASYAADAQQFSRIASSEGTSIDPRNIAIIDQKITKSTGLSFLPAQGFKQIGLTGAGKAVYSTEAAATNGDLGMGQTTLRNTALSLANLGITDESILNEVGALSEKVSSPELMSSLDNVSQEKGPQELTKTILMNLNGDMPSTKTANGQQLVAGAARIAELWPNLSPSQKSSALAALSSNAVEQKTGKNISAQKVPGTERSVIGGLTSGEAMTATTQGINGFGAARNWEQASAILDIASPDGLRDKNQVFNVGTSLGMFGVGPQGAAVSEQLNPSISTPAPQLGVGAALVPRGTQIPKDYEMVTTTPEGYDVVIPKANKGTSVFGKGSVTPLAYQKAVAIANGKHPAMKMWGRTPTRGISRGSAGGSAMLASLDSIRESNPSLYSGTLAHSFFNNTIGSD